jgi:hypothetical protein
MINTAYAIINTAYAIAVAAIAAALFVAFPSLSPQAACTRDGRIPLAQPRDVRFIAAERIADASPAR